MENFRDKLMKFIGTVYLPLIILNNPYFEDFCQSLFNIGKI